MNIVKITIITLVIITSCTFINADSLKEEKIINISQKVQNISQHIIDRTVAIRIVLGARQGFGSGAIISEDGLILTCAHVAEISDNLEVILSDGKEYKAEKLGMNARNDYALLKISRKKKFPYFKLGKSREIKLLDWVITSGHPGGPYSDRKPAIAIGRVLGLNRKLPINFGMKFYDNTIVTDAPIFSGNSGGPLIDLKGNLLGINGAIMLVNDFAFSIPIDDIKGDYFKLKAGKDVEGRFPGNIFELVKIILEWQDEVSPEDMYKMFEKTKIGKMLKFFMTTFSSTPPPKRPQLGLTVRPDKKGGVFIEKIDKGRIGALAGFKKKDIIISVNKERVYTPEGIEDILNTISLDEQTVFELKRKNKIIKIKVLWEKKKYGRRYVLKKAFYGKGMEFRKHTVRLFFGHKALGYGVIIEPDGTILTNNRIIEKYKKISVLVLKSKTKYEAVKLGKSEVLDIALLKIKPEEKLEPIKIAKGLKIGELVFSGGKEEGVIQAGIVSALKRSVLKSRRMPVLGLFGMFGSPNKSPLRAYDKVIHHDSYIKEDQFGTPLLNLKDELLGINVANIYPGTTFAIPISDILKILPDLKKGKNILAYSNRYKPEAIKPDKFSDVYDLFFENDKRKKREALKRLMKPEKKGFMGVQIKAHPDGIEIAEVLIKHSAYRAGLKVGDIIIKFEGKKIKDIHRFVNQVKKHKPGDKIRLTILRKKGTKFIKKDYVLTLDSYPLF